LHTHYMYKIYKFKNYIFYIKENIGFSTNLAQ
jgi:hypothetical protein